MKIPLNSALVDNCHKDPFQQEDSALPLSQLIPVIIAQRGSFLSVTEQGLLEEIDSLSRNSPDNETEALALIDPDNSNSNAAENDVTTTQEDFLKAKSEALTLVRSALNESHLSLDFVSLLISCLRPAAGTTSMSPHLKQFVRVGSLNSDKIVAEDDPNEAERVSRVGQGWKLDSLTRAGSSLRSASTRLSEEVLKERKYWGDVVQVLKCKEVLTKSNSLGGTSGNTKEFGVKYGFGDSGSNYFDKGIGLLKKNNVYGNVMFRPATNEQIERTYKVVTVRVLGNVDDQFVLLGQSDIKTQLAKFERRKQSGIPVLSEIERARFFLFEEELFYQLLKEAATLLSTNVQVESNKIIVNLHNEVVEIEAIAPDMSEEDNEDDDMDVSKPLSVHDRRAELIALFLRLMLCAHHKRNREKKRQPPKSLQQLNPEQHAQNSHENVLLLRPFIGYYKHNEFVRELESILKETVQKVFDNDFARAEKIMNDPETFKITRSHKHASEVSDSDPFGKCITPPQSDFQLTIPLKTGTGSLKIVIATSGTQTFCNLSTKIDIYRITPSGSVSDTDDYELLLDVSFNDLRDLQDCLSWAIPQYVI